MQRRRFLQSVGASAVVPLSATQVVSASNLSELRQSESQLLRYQPARPRSQNHGIGDTFNYPPIIDGDRAFIPDPGSIPENRPGATIVYSQNGRLHSTNKDEVSIDQGILQPQGPVNGTMTGQQSGGEHKLKVNTGESEITIESNDETIQIRPGEEQSLPGYTPTAETDESNTGDNASIYNHGVKTTYWHPNKRLFPLNDTFGNMLNRAKAKADEKGTSLDQVMSTDIVQRNVEVISDIDAIAIEETHVPYQGDSAPNTDQPDAEQGPRSKQHQRGRSPENRGGE